MAGAFFEGLREQNGREILRDLQAGMAWAAIKKLRLVKAQRHDRAICRGPAAVIAELACMKLVITGGGMASAWLRGHQRSGAL
jgi:hypothetical protein